ncbi:restriction endonuclease subunit S [Acinetobacter baumannii]|nr:restriction endonuclease subunit S [Acinetobacter baumannii]TPS30119.1 restriction endonuclease subunit S [Acinetobacter baumannii]
MTAPKLRFKEFDGNWDIYALEDQIDFLAGYAFDSKLMSNDIQKYQLIKMSNVYQNQLDLTRNSSYWEKIDKKTEKFLLKKGDIVLTLTGTVGKTDYGYNVEIKENDKFLLNQRLVRLRGKIDFSLSKFVQYRISTDKFFYHFFNSSKGGTGNQSNVSIEDLKLLELSFPSKAEQTKIATFLSAVDEKISQLTQKHELLSQYKQGMMQKLFSQQIRFKADDGSEFGEWRKAKVGNITETIFGYPFDSKEMVEDNNGIPLMRGINIGECHIRHSFELDRFFLKDTSKLEKYFVRVNDIVLSMDGSKVGRNSAFVTEKDAGSLLVQRVCILREKENTNIQYVYQWIISKEFHRYVDQVKTSSGITHISGKQIQDYEISYPCLEEQTKIANFLSAIDQKIGVVAQQIEHAKQWKKGLLQQMFV